ncbi:MAG: EF2563 family selenium-dependent molybdenum hydroxylase system protein [Desulfovibrio sp.]|nr:EF2563 family selenium-dependent molybdenum hydroxylase system protein [Desulfovibrio sp.]
MTDRKTGLETCRVVIKGGGEMASGVAVRLHQAGIRNILLLEIAAPLAVRRTVSFSEAVYDGEQEIEGIHACLARHVDDILALWRREMVAVAVDPEWRLLDLLQPRVCIDAILAKRNTGTRMDEAPLVLALGPGFTAGLDAHAVIETQRGHNLGRIYRKGAAEENTGLPGAINGYTLERLLRSPEAGKVDSVRKIGELARAGEIVLNVNGVPVAAGIDGVIRGLIRPGITVPSLIKLGDIDPRGCPEYCLTVSEKARALGGAALEAVCAYLAGNFRG